MKAAAARDPIPPPTRYAFDFVFMSSGSSENACYAANAGSDHQIITDVQEDSTSLFSCTSVRDTSN
jgi:hypothetical protein